MKDYTKELLEMLERNPSWSDAQLATMLNREEAEITVRRRQLEADKIIVQYQTLVNWEKAGVETVSAFIHVRITPQREVGFDAIAERIYRFPEVRGLYLMSGAYDLLVMVEGSTLKEAARFVSTKLSTIEGVVGTETHFMLKKYKEAGVILEDREEDCRLAVSP